ncbi:TetR/AcrR family transcriptional regulator C-terminal domain-containing protein [Streptomyces montanisoli]|uniref:TetR/AcrR family transcriptional regulator C-terminal domain-containing protein n=1 Tax=Streptomyces montanisoli TaxID=2798581 RepID=A0A940MJR4_9ACTN|nr:TetR/AcrR family transcriptional regulator C-terminal domain-containing protein [Streptomyces montanisoli]MBP0460591.1 TetR/AcrR family transcriptional regulator C-terminal domain-containing protein [Streptomyces montanisoli]
MTDATARQAPYRRIVGELRRRIETGDLAPGARVPSTRELTRACGIAMATATKVLTELRREGLVRAVPGVGTVVADRRPTTAGASATADASAPPRAASDSASASDARASATGPIRRPQDPDPARPRAHAPRPATALDLASVVAAAVAVADAEGIDAVSMRRLAADLGVATMSLYRHVNDKDDLLLRMMDAVFADAPLPGPTGTGVDTGVHASRRARLELAARALWALLRRHPWLASAMSLTRPQALPHAISFTEWVLDALDGLGLDSYTAFTIHLTLFNYTRGTAVNVEAEAVAEATTGMDSEEWLDTQEPALEASLGSGGFPVFRRLLAEGYDFDLDALFEFGLQRLLDGIEPLIAG